MSKVFAAITIPKWGIEMTRGTILEWHKAVGDEVSAGEEIVDIESDKTINGFEARDSGTLVRILADAGDELEVGALIGVLALEAVDDAAVDAFIAEHRGAGSGATDVTAQGGNGAQGAPKKREGPPISPALARKLTKAGIDPTTVQGSGPKGRILKEDVDRALAEDQSSASTGASAEGDGQVLAGSQRVVAERLGAAQRNVPLFHVTVDAVVDGTKQWLSDNPGVSLNAVLLRALGLAVVEYAPFNVQFDGEKKLAVSAGNVALAVAQDGAVQAPVISGADTEAWTTLQSRIDSAVEQARAGRVTKEFQEPAAVTLSNLGMFGVREFTAMVTPPQVLVLSVGSMRPQLVLDADGQVKEQSVMTLTLGSDHRVVNGADAARLLARIREHLEAPGP